jgi:cytochrome P450
MLRDEKLYPDPDVFNPERFMEKVDEEITKKRDPRNACFGFGRRLLPNPLYHQATHVYYRRCPGADLVESSLWILIASMLAVLDFSKVVDELGNIVEPEVVYENPVFRYVPRCRLSAFSKTLSPQVTQCFQVQYQG